MTNLSVNRLSVDVCGLSKRMPVCASGFQERYLDGGQYLVFISLWMLIEAMVVDKIYRGEGVEWEEKRDNIVV